MKASSYEEKVIQLLKQSGIKFQREKTFSDLKGGSFRYDFYLPSRQCILEIDGQYHWKPIRGRAALLKQQEHDRIKNSYCLAHNIPLYRIPYWEMDKISNSFDLFKNQYRVSSKWHNDYLKPPK